jgi:hypothetical protein
MVLKRSGGCCGSESGFDIELLVIVMMMVIVMMHKWVVPLAYMHV